MAKELIPYLDMCRREGAGLRRGMHFSLGITYSVLLMSVQSQAPYQDRFTADGTTLIYEGHDEPQSAAVPHPKAVDQPLRTAYDTPTQNAKFHEAAQAYKHDQQPPEQVKVYEKCRPGLWLYRGLFYLVESWQESDGRRQVFKLLCAHHNLAKGAGYPNRSKGEALSPSLIVREGSDGRTTVPPSPPPSALPHRGRENVVKALRIDYSLAAAPPL